MEEAGYLLLIIAVLICLSLFFSVITLALRTLSRFKLQEALRESDKEDLLDEIVSKTETMSLSCRFFLSISNILLFMSIMIFFQSRHGSDIHKWDYLWTFVCAVLLFSISTVSIPHAWAKYSGEKIVSRTYALLKVLACLSWPMLFIFKFYDDLIRRLSGVVELSEEESQEEKHDELLSAVEQSKVEGVVDEEELEMIENVLDFSETTAGEIITPRIELIALNVDSELQTVLDTIIQAGHSRIPVYEGTIDKIIGLVYAKDLLLKAGQSPSEFKLRDIIREAYFVPESKLLRDLLHEFQNKKQHIAVVLDEYGGTAGIVTIEDILEELVGEIADEYEKTPPASIKVINEDTIEVDAKYYIDDLNSEFELNLPEEEDYETVGGFVFSHLGYIPKTGDNFEFDHLRLTISSAEARKVKRIRIQKLPGFKKEAQ